MSIKATIRDLEKIEGCCQPGSAWRETIGDAIALLKTHPDNQPNEPQGDGWIRVKDSLPEPLVTVLVFHPHDPGGVPRVSIGFHYRIGGWLCENFSAEPTHWRPLPEPPEEVMS